MRINKNKTQILDILRYYFLKLSVAVCLMSMQIFTNIRNLERKVFELS